MIRTMSKSAELILIEEALTSDKEESANPASVMPVEKLLDSLKVGSDA